MKKIEDIELGLRIKLLRSELRMNQKEFSELIGSTVSALSNWENGRNKPKLDMIKKIAYVSEVDYNDLLHGDLRMYIFQNLQHCFSKEDSHLAAYVSNETLTNLVRDMESAPNSYDLDILKELVSEYYSRIESDFINSLCEDTDVDPSHVENALRDKNTECLSDFAENAAKKSFLDSETILNTLFNMAGIDSSNYLNSNISETLPINKNKLRLLLFEKDTEVQIETKTKSVKEFIDLKHMLYRDTKFTQYYSSKDTLKAKHIDLPVVYDGKELSKEQIDKVSNYIESLI